MCWFEHVKIKCCHLILYSHNHIIIVIIKHYKLCNPLNLSGNRIYIFKRVEFFFTDLCDICVMQIWEHVSVSCVCMGALCTSMSVYCVHVWCPWRWEEGIGSPGSGVMDCCKVPCGCWKHNQVLCKNKYA